MLVQKMNVRILFFCSIFFLSASCVSAENNFASRPSQKQIGSKIFEQSDVQKAIRKFCRILLIDPHNKTARENFEQIVAYPALTAQQKAEVFLLEDLLDYIENLNRRIVYLTSKRDLLKDRLVKNGFDKIMLFEGLLDIRSSMFLSQQMFFYPDKPVLSQSNPLAYVSRILLDEKEKFIMHIQYLQRQYHWLKMIGEDRRYSLPQQFARSTKIAASQTFQHITKQEDRRVPSITLEKNERLIGAEVFRESEEVSGFSYVRLDKLKENLKQKDDKINKLADQIVDLSLRMSEIETILNAKVEVVRFLKAELIDIQQRSMLEQRIIQEKNAEIQSLQNTLKQLQPGSNGHNDNVSLSRDEKLIQLTGILEIYKYKLVEKNKVAQEKMKALVKTQNDLLDLKGQMAIVQFEMLKLKSHSRHDELQDKEIETRVQELQSKFQDIQHFLLENLPDSDKINTHLVIQEF